MGGRVGRGAQRAFHHLTGVEVDYHHVVGSHGIVVYPRGFYYHEAALAVDTAYVAPGEYHETMAHEIHVGLIYFFLEFF